MFKPIYTLRLLSLFLLLSLPDMTQAQFTFTTNADGSLNIANYTGSGGDVTIPDMTNGLPITSIGIKAFDFISVTNINIGTNVNIIDDFAFRGSGLTSVMIPKSVTSIGNFAFFVCFSLTNVVLGNGVTNIGQGAFTYCPLINLTFSANLLSIGDNALGGADLTNITFPNGVINIGNFMFQDCTNLTSIVIPNSAVTLGNFGGMIYGSDALTTITIGSGITNLPSYAFAIRNGELPSLTSVFFVGNAPSDDSTLFDGDTNATIYYLPNTTGWGLTFGGRPAVLWNPRPQTDDASFGVQNNQFGFNITGSSNLVIVVEACTNLANPVWSSVTTNTLNTFIGTNGTSYFSDPQWTNYPARYYRLRSP